MHHTANYTIQTVVSFFLCIKVVLDIGARSFTGVAFVRDKLPRPLKSRTFHCEADLLRDS